MIFLRVLCIYDIYGNINAYVYIYRGSIYISIETKQLSTMFESFKYRSCMSQTIRHTKTTKLVTTKREKNRSNPNMKAQFLQKFFMIFAKIFQISIYNIYNAYFAVVIVYCNLYIFCSSLCFIFSLSDFYIFINAKE